MSAPDHWQPGTSAIDTLELLHKEWINKAGFIGQGSERDPMVGVQHGNFTCTLPREPVHQQLCGLETVSGEYLFMPSLPALKWLGELP